MMRRRVFALTLVLALGGSVAARAQEVKGEDEAVRVRTRVVFLDALVRDKRTSAVVSGLKPENFEVLADGRPRAVSYFSREGDEGRRPLALTIILDLERLGAGRHLRRTDILEALAAVLAKLPPQDEVALLALDVGGTGRREWLTRFTRDRARLAAALSVVPLLVAEGSEAGETHDGQSQKAASPQPTPQPTPEPTPTPEPDSERKEGLGEIRTVNKDGSVTVKYLTVRGDLIMKTTKDGKEVGGDDDDETVELGSAVHEAILTTLAERPLSQGAVVWVSDGVVPVFYKERDQTTASLIQTNVIFSALTSEMKTGFKLFKPVLKPLGGLVNLSIYGASQHIARETGGEAVSVRRPEDYARGLEKIVGNLTGRYALGFALGESEQDDGRMHELEVRARARDEKGKERKLHVVSRRGYFMPKEGETAQRRDSQQPKP